MKYYQVYSIIIKRSHLVCFYICNYHKKISGKSKHNKKDNLNSLKFTLWYLFQQMRHDDLIFYLAFSFFYEWCYLPYDHLDYYQEASLLVSRNNELISFYRMKLINAYK